MRKLVYIILFAILPVVIHGQDKEIIDSLETALKRTPDKEKAEIYNNLARVYSYNDKPERAIEYSNKAYEFAKDFKDEKQLALAQLIFGESNNALKKYDIAILSFKEALVISRRIDEKQLTADILSSLGSLEDDLGNTDTALIYLNEALEISKKIDYYKGISRTLNYIGFSYYFKSNFSKAIEFFEQAFNYSFENNDTIAMEINARVLGACYYRQGNYTKAVEKYIQSLKLSEALNNNAVVAGNMLNIANVYQLQKYYDEALEYLLAAKGVYETEQDTPRLAICYNNMGNLLLEKISKTIDTLKKADKYTEKDSLNIINEYKLAKNFLDSAIQINEKLKDSVNLQSNYANRAIILYNLKKYNEAEKEYDHALSIAKKLQDNEQISVILQSAGDLYIKTKNYAKALSYYERSLELARELDILELQQNNYQGLSEVHEIFGDYRKALNSYKKYVEVKDILFNEESQKTISQMKEIYESEKKQEQLEKFAAQDEAQKATIKQQKTVNIAIGVGAIFLLAFLVFAFRQIQLIKKKNILLNEKNIQINQQKEEIEAQRDEIQAQRDLVMKQKEEITDSIHYAQRIQRAVLPSGEFTNKILPEHFILFRPRDIVSGDFYYITKKNNKVITVAADCTGHGVPGAFMSMLGVSFLNEIVNKLDEPESHTILNHLRRYVKTTLDQTGKADEAKDGMDIALTILDFENMTAEYAGAYNPLLIVRPGEEEIIEYKADKMPIGIYIKEKESFTKNTFELKKGDMLYTFSDGYIDQFGGDSGRKFMSKHFKQLLMSMQDKPMAEQRDILDRTIDEWRGVTPQIDDIIILGIRIS